MTPQGEQSGDDRDECGGEQCHRVDGDGIGLFALAAELTVDTWWPLVHWGRPIPLRGDSDQLGPSLGAVGAALEAIVLCVGIVGLITTPLTRAGAQRPGSRFTFPSLLIPRIAK